MKKAIVYLTFIFVSCTGMDNRNPIVILKKYTTIDFKSSEVKELRYNIQTSGMLGDESTLIAVYEFSEIIDIGLLRERLVQAGFKSIPIPSNDGVLDSTKNIFYSENDIGLYRIKFRRAESIQEWVVFNFTKRQIVLDVDF